jgi:hypothetical protein
MVFENSTGMERVWSALARGRDSARWQDPGYNSGTGEPREPRFPQETGHPSLTPQAGTTLALGPRC